MFEAFVTVVSNFCVQIKKLDLSWNEFGNSGANALATCLWNIEEVHLYDCDITECQELCNVIQSLEKPVSFNLALRHTASVKSS